MKLIKRMMLAVALCVVTAVAAMAQPILRMPAILSDHMVLQENTTVKIWGWADPNATVTVTPSWGEAVVTKSLFNTRWMVEITTRSSRQLRRSGELIRVNVLRVTPACRPFW